MQENLALFALILLIASHSLLIKKCFKIEGEIPLHFHQFENKADVIDGNLAQVRDLLDEALDFINEFASQPVPQMPQNMGLSEVIATTILNRFIPSTSMPSDHASKTKPLEREIYEVHPTTTLDTEDEPIEYSPVSIDG